METVRESLKSCKETRFPFRMLDRVLAVVFTRKSLILSDFMHKVAGQNYFSREKSTFGLT